MQISPGEMFLTVCGNVFSVFLVQLFFQLIVTVSASQLSNPLSMELQNGNKVYWNDAVALKKLFV